MGTMRVRHRNGTNPLAVEAQRCGRVFFGNPKLAHISALAFNAARFIPSVVRDELDRRGQWPDVVNSIYAMVIEFWRHRRTRSFDPQRRSDYKEFVRFIWNNLYGVLRDLLPNYKRPCILRYVRPEKFRYLEKEDAESGLPFSREIDLDRASVET